MQTVELERTGDERSPRRGDILDAALECFTARGYQRTTMEEIRARSGASIGSIYHHFGGKEQLAAALYLEALADYQGAFLRVLSVAPDAGRAVKGVVRNHLRWVAGNPKLATFLLSSREAEVVLATQQQVVEMNRRVIEITRAWIDREVEGGALRAMPTRLFYAVLIGPSQEFARQWVGERDAAALKAALKELPEAAWRAVRA
jgi:AcrR family transcriptional regulator